MFKDGEDHIEAEEILSRLTAIHAAGHLKGAHLAQEVEFRRHIDNKVNEVTNRRKEVIHPDHPHPHPEHPNPKLRR